MAYWLIKTEPKTWSWQNQQQQKKTLWDGVRNYQANNFMKEMAMGDLCFFYHSVVGKEIVGIVSVSEIYQKDPSDPTGHFGMVEVTYSASLRKPVSLKKIKSDPRFCEFKLVKMSRLSVMPVSEQEWGAIMELSQS